MVFVYFAVGSSVILLTESIYWFTHRGRSRLRGWLPLTGLAATLLFGVGYYLDPLSTDRAAYATVLKNGACLVMLLVIPVKWKVQRLMQKPGDPDA